MKLAQEPGRQAHVLFTHFHMDHVIGFPFFAPVYTPGFEIDITVPANDDDEAREKLGAFLNGRYHPVRLREMPSELRFHAIRPGRAFERSGYTIKGVALNHPGGSCGYRIQADGKSICYITDSSPFAQPGDGVLYDREPTPGEARMIAFLRDADVVVYDTMFELAEYLEKMTWGHSYPEYARGLCAAAGVKHLVLFHHSPDASDELLDERAKAWSAATAPRVTLAREGESVFAEG